jgi:hypothetical protein
MKLQFRIRFVKLHQYHVIDEQWYFGFPISMPAIIVKIIKITKYFGFVIWKYV